MPTKKTQSDWSDEAIRRFWDWQARNPQAEENFFSRQVGQGLASLLDLAGVLKGRILDFGCGTGFLLEQLCRAPGVRCEGVDFSPQSVQATQQRLAGISNFAGAQAIESRAPYDPATFDCVTCIETIEHLKDARLDSLLSEIHGLLKPGGTAMFTTPCDEKLDRAVSYCPFCDSEFHHMQHVRSFTPESLETRLRRAGYEVLFCRGLDLWRFQPPAPRGILRYSLADVLGRTRRRVRFAIAACLDAVSPRPFPQNRRFKACLRPGPHLVAVARRPAS